MEAIWAVVTMPCREGDLSTPTNAWQQKQPELALVNVDCSTSITFCKEKNLTKPQINTEDWHNRIGSFCVTCNQWEAFDVSEFIGPLFVIKCSSHFHIDTYKHSWHTLPTHFSSFSFPFHFYSLLFILS